jgi:hypothetical protein
MRNKIFGGIGILWGGAALLRWFTSGTPNGGASAYQDGQSAGVIFAALMLVAGLYYFFRKPS